MILFGVRKSYLRFRFLVHIVREYNPPALKVKVLGKSKRKQGLRTPKESGLRSPQMQLLQMAKLLQVFWFENDF